MTQTNFPPSPVRVALAGESELVTRGLEAMLEPYDDITLVPASPGGGLATFVHITLHDTFGRLPLSEDLLERLAKRPAGGRLAVYSWHVPEEMVAVAFNHGAAACLSKHLPAEELVDALRAVAAGETIVRTVADEHAHARRVGLTPREHEVIGLIAAGLTNLEIAATMSLSVNSIKSYIRSGYRKIHATSRSQAVLWAVHHGIVRQPTRRPDPGPGQRIA
jgi:DNA-binding NarL/FixJ family response regulator